MELLLKNKILKTSRIDKLNNYVVVGTTTSELHGIMANKSDKITLINGSSSARSINIECQNFHTFYEGILFQSKEGSPITYTNFNETVTIAPENFYLNPIHQGRGQNNALLVKMDLEFNQKYFILTRDLKYTLTDNYPKILGEDKFIFYNKTKVEVFNLIDKKLIWDLVIPQIEQVERRNQGKAVFTDENFVFVRFIEGRIKCLSIFNGNLIWEYKPPFKEVSYGEIEDRIYVHTGNEIIELNKETGEEIRSVNYGKYDRLVKFRSNGIIWCWKEIILTRNSFSGEFAVFNRSTFELVEYQIVDNAGIPESEDCIRYLNNHLYILSTSSTLYIYELTKMIK